MNITNYGSGRSRSPRRERIETRDLYIIPYPDYPGFMSDEVLTDKTRPAMNRSSIGFPPLEELIF